jgi:16S rRNA (cytidine1402-2'-O)-methyltransferase
VAGKLLVIGTPLGNLDDISRRALDALTSVDLIACEDTRRTSRLLAHFGIRTALVSCHRFNERARIDGLLRRLRDGATVGLVTDSGTPAVADPGRELVRAAVEEGIDVRPVPGPSAVTALLSVSGFDADRFVFDGFLPHRAGERRRRLRELRGETRTVVVFETPHRIGAALRDLSQVLGERPLPLARELSKVHETVLRGTAAEVAARLEEPVRGEIAIAIAGAVPGESARVDETEAATLAAWREALVAAGGDRRTALRAAARSLGLSRPELTRRLMELDPEPEEPDA